MDSMTGSVRIDRHLSDADEHAIVNGLRSFNEAWIGPSNEEVVRFVAR